MMLQAICTPVATSSHATVSKLLLSSFKGLSLKSSNNTPVALQLHVAHPVVAAAGYKLKSHKVRDA